MSLFLCLFAINADRFFYFLKILENIVDIISQAYNCDIENDRIKLAFQFVDSIKKYVSDRIYNNAGE